MSARDAHVHSPRARYREVTALHYARFGMGMGGDHRAVARAYLLSRGATRRQIRYSPRQRRLVSHLAGHLKRLSMTLVIVGEMWGAEKEEWYGSRPLSEHMARWEREHHA